MKNIESLNRYTRSPRFFMLQLAPFEMVLRFWPLRKGISRQGANRKSQIENALALPLLNAQSRLAAGNQ